MATTDAIAFLGDTLVALLREGLDGVVAPADVILSTPDDFKAFTPLQPSVTVFLYHVALHGEMRNAPRRSGLNGVPRRPSLPLELRFLVTPWTRRARDAYRIIGMIALAFYDHPVLSFGELQGDGVWAADDTVELLMESLPVEQHYDIWEPTDIPYRLSLAYLARVVGIDSAVRVAAAPVAQASAPVEEP